MVDAFIELGLFAAKTAIIIASILFVLVTFFALLAKAKEKIKSRLVINHLNRHYQETAEQIYAETLPKKAFKRYLKSIRRAEKARNVVDDQKKTVFVLNFHGDVRASAVSHLSEEITAILTVAKPQDEVLLRLESAGGVVHGYGLAAAQLMRLRAKKIPLTIAIDKVAASGGYMMACVADKIIAAPFAIIGSIGVVVQFPNFHRYLQDKNIDFEQHTAGEFKRTITLFGENTEAGRQKLQQEIEDIHQLFKTLIADHRKDIDIQKVATGEYWMGQQALDLKLVDTLETSDDYLLTKSQDTDLYEVYYEIRKPFLARLTGSANSFLREKFSQLLKLPT